MPHVACTTSICRTASAAAERGSNAVPETPSVPCAFVESTSHEARAKLRVKSTCVHICVTCQSLLLSVCVLEALIKPLCAQP